jgi:hypothetical protein
MSDAKARLVLGELNDCSGNSGDHRGRQNGERVKTIAAKPGG